MSYQSMEEAKLRGEKENIPFWKAIQLEDAQERDVKIEDSWEKMKYMWQSMLDALDAYEPDKVSRSGLVGTEGGLMDNYRENEEPLCGDFVSKVMSNALKMGCNNACMKRIVAAPTAGACGVLPAVLVTYYKEYNVPEEKMIEAMYVAAGLGQIIANRAMVRSLPTGHILREHREDVRQRSVPVREWQPGQSAISKAEIRIRSDMPVRWH